MSDVIQDYIMQFPEEIQGKLLEIRKIIEQTIPEATQKIAWGMPSYSVAKRFLIHFSVHKAHISLHVGTKTVEFFKDVMVPYKGTKSTMHLKFTDAIPSELIQEMLRYNYNRCLDVKEDCK